MQKQDFLWVVHIQYQVYIISDEEDVHLCLDKYNIDHWAKNSESVYEDHDLILSSVSSQIKSDYE